MKTTNRFAALLLGTTTVFASLAVGTASPATADNCEPTEPVMRVLFPATQTTPQYEERIMDPRDNIICYTMINYVYPRLCDNPATLLGTCINSVRPDPFEPIAFFPYSPNGARMVCNLQTYVLVTTGVSGSPCTPTA